MTRLAWATLLLLASACVFRDAPAARFFRPESAKLDATAAAPAAGAASVRLRPVSATPFLREPMVWRSSPVESGLYEQWRWSELPASYVQRALETSLRETAGVQLTDDPHAPALRVQVLSFDEVVAPALVANVTLAVSLSDRAGGHLIDRNFSAEAPLVGEAPAAIAVAMGRALDDVVAQVAAAVGEALRAPRAKR